MKFSLKFLMMFVAAISIVMAFVATLYSPIKIETGMAREDVFAKLNLLEAIDFSPCVLVSGSPEFDPAKATVWWLERHGIYVETVFDNDELVEINVWNLDGQLMDDYYRDLEYESVSEIAISTTGRKFNVKTIKIVVPAAKKYGEGLWSFSFD